MKKIKNILAIGLIMALIIPATAKANAPGSVVINEIAWMGTLGSTNHEWIELYNTTDQAIDLTGWIIDDDDGTQTYALTGTIAAKSYFLIEDIEETTSVASDLIIGLSLTNTGDKLVLKNTAGETVDAVNTAGGAWYAGDNDTKATMERKDTANVNDVAENWANNAQGNGATDSLGNALNGTPKSLNSVATGNQPVNVTLTVNNATPAPGENIIVSIKAQEVSNLFAYGFDITYNPQVLDFIQADKGDFLSEGGAITTSFQSGLENGQEGKLIIGEARTLENKTGIDGSGTLFTATFNVIGNIGSSSMIEAAAGSFLASSGADMLCAFTDTQMSVTQIIVVNPVQNLQAQEGVARYELLLTWDVPVGGADTYKVLRKNTAGNFIELNSTGNTSFADNNNLIPNLDYTYQVIAQKGNGLSEPMQVIQKDTRGIKGDVNRSDRVDGRDLEKLAKHFTEILNDPGFDPLTDTTYDGVVNGNDLIDIGINWAVTYTE